MIWLRVLHVLGVIVWIGGIVSLAFVAASASTKARETTTMELRQVVSKVVTPAMLLAWIAGLVVLVDGWSLVYSKAGWMHAKVTFALLLTGFTGMLTGRLRKAATGQRDLSSGFANGMGVLHLVLAAFVVVFVLAKPF